LGKPKILGLDWRCENHFVFLHCCVSGKQREILLIPGKFFVKTKPKTKIRIFFSLKPDIRFLFFTCLSPLMGRGGLFSAALRLLWPDRAAKMRRNFKTVTTPVCVLFVA
jgi:hypothetical protein